MRLAGASVKKMATIVCIHSSSFQGYAIAAKHQLSERDCHALKRIVSKNYRTTAAKVTAEFSVQLLDPVSTKTVEQELHKSNIHGRAAIAKPLIIENNAKS